ncbi:MAG TPA: DeoR/GlpR family DNA-binding transcription regulator [Steroidobacteraceae bacterium]|nr:DeoR/GlpR family DNA-binding transcription regulator [Steroidobacteraceae bacterium]
MGKRSEPMGLEQRRRAIRGLLQEQPQVSVAELARRFGVSTVTVRSDLSALDDIGALVRVHGGALPRGESEELPIDIKQNFHRAEKARIAAAAVEFIEDGQTIILDSGTTTAELARLIRGLKFQSLNVITNALNIAVLLASAPFITLIIPGGMLRRRSWSLSGPPAENAIRDLQADTLFLGVDSLDPEVGLMTPHVLEAQLNAQMIRIARRVIAVTDSSKLLRRNLSVISNVDQVDLLITDRGADARAIKSMRARGVEVKIV